MYYFQRKSEFFTLEKPASSIDAGHMAVFIFSNLESFPSPSNMV